MLAWDGVRDASAPGPTPQRRPFGPVTTIPEPCFPGDDTLNVNVFTPAPGEPDAALPVFVWIHGGGYFAGSSSSPWYDGRSFNRDRVVTVSISYRLGFDGFGWIEDAPTNRGVRDQIAGLQWVQDNIAAFGGDPARVTIGGQSAGGSSVMSLLASPAAQQLFAGVVCHSGAGLFRTLAEAEHHGRALASRAGVEPTRAGWSTVSEDEILDLQTAYMMPPQGPVPTPAEYVSRTLASPGIPLAFVPLVGDDVLPLAITDAIAAGVGADKALLAGTVAHEFTMGTMGYTEAWADADPVQALVDGGLTRENAQSYVASHPELTTAAATLGQLSTDLSFRAATIGWADARTAPAWLYDFRWPAPGGLTYHCLDLPFAWDVLDAPGVTAVCGDTPPQDLADEMHTAWVRFITTGDPGWTAWTGHNPYVFGADQADTYAPTRMLLTPH